MAAYAQNTRPPVGFFLRSNQWLYLFYAGSIKKSTQAAIWMLTVMSIHYDYALNHKVALHNVIFSSNKLGAACS